MADFEGGDLTTDGGLPLLREVDQTIGLIDAFDSAIHDPRCPWLTEHDQRTILAQRMSALAARALYIAKDCGSDQVVVFAETRDGSVAASV